jgi:hypothetical protein
LAPTATDARRIRVLTATVFAFAFIYRFNALGGTLAGFDDDHFLYYLRARAVADGERPLRDFVDAGLQGAWPALSYELPALFQKWGGQTLLADAVLSVGAIALSVAIVFRLAARLTSVWPALLAALLTLFASAKLYAYPKLLTFAVAALLLGRYVREPTRANVALLAVWSAVAFLFRHDFLVYLAPAVVAAVALGTGRWRVTATQIALFGGIIVLLLVGPAYSVQRYVGLARYVETGRAISQREAERTDIEWPRFVRTPGGGVVAFFRDERNAVAWLYYLCFAIPAAAVGREVWIHTRLGSDPERKVALVVALGITGALLNWFFLRGNLPARFGDLGAPIAILGALLLAGRPGGAGRRRHAVRAAAVAILLPTVLAVDTIGSVRRELATTGFTEDPVKLVEKAYAVITELNALPPAPIGDPAGGVPELSEYLRACTAPGDRVLTIASAPSIAAMASRSFAGGHPTFTPGFYTSIEDQQLALQRLRGQSVPVVVTAREATYLEDLAPEFPLIHEYVVASYESVGELPATGRETMRVLVKRGVSGVRVYGTTGLPCFR